MDNETVNNIAKSVSGREHATTLRVRYLMVAISATTLRVRYPDGGDECNTWH